MSVAERETRRWTVEEYHRASEAGVFEPDERLELIDGKIFRMSPQPSAHATVLGLVDDALRAAFGDGFCVRVQMPLQLGLESEPEPDVCVVRGSRRDYLAAHPTRAELVVEVSDTTAGSDLITKASLYARGEIPEYWAVVLPERAVVVHRRPDPRTGEYGEVTRCHGETALSPLAVGGAIRVLDLLP